MTLCRPEASVFALQQRKAPDLQQNRLLDSRLAGSCATPPRWGTLRDTDDPPTPSWEGTAGTIMPERQQFVRLLQQVPLLNGLGPNDLAGVAAASQCRELEPGRFFFRQGTAADAVYVLNRGRVKLTQSTPEQVHVLLRFIIPGDMFGPTSFDGQPYTISAEATRWSQALAWKVPTMIALMERYPSVAMNALREMSARLQELRERYRELATERVERRVAHALIRLARQAGWRRESGFLLVDIPLSRQDLAEMTGTTLYTVSRILSGWERDGIIESGRQRLALLQPSAVQAIAENLPGDPSAHDKSKTESDAR